MRHQLHLPPRGEPSLPAAPVRAPRPAPRHHRLAALGAFLAGLVTLGVVEETRWLGDGLAAVLPTTGLQVAVAVVLPVGVLGCLVVAARRPAGAPFPVRERALVTGLLVAMFLIAPIARGLVWSTAAQVVPALVWTEYACWAVLALAAWIVQRWRRRAAGDDVSRGPSASRSAWSRSPGSRSAWSSGGALVPRPRRSPRLPNHGLLEQAAAVAVPVVLVAGLMALGAHVGAPPVDPQKAGSQEADPLADQPPEHHHTVAALQGTDLGPAFATRELVGDAGLEPALAAGDLTQQRIGRIWESVLRTAPTTAAPEGYDVALTVDRLDQSADQHAAAARLATAAPDQRVANGWLSVFTQDDALAVLDGRDVLVLRMLAGGTAGDRAAEVRHLAGELTPARRAALVSAITTG